MKKKRCIPWILTGALALSLAVPVRAASLQAFADLEPDAWYAKAVTYVTDNGIMHGVEETLFAPLDLVTRGMVYQTLYNLAGRPTVEEPASFPDVEGTWYADAAAWAEDIGLTTGTGNGQFSGAQIITRQELAKIFTGYAAQNGIFPTESELPSFTDLDEVAAWAEDSIAAAVSLGILQGSGGQLNPTGPAQRVELAQLLLNYSSLVSQVPTLRTTILKVNREGDLTLDLTRAAFLGAGYAVGDIVTLSSNGKRLEAPVVTSLGDVDPGRPLVLLPEKGEAVTVLLHSGSLAAYFGVSADDRLSLAMRDQGGYRGEYEIRNLSALRTNKREEYGSDQIFANFRPIVVGNMAAGVLYRSSSPVNPALGRSTFADELANAAGIKTVLNLCDAQEELEEYASYANSYYATTQVVALDMELDMTAEENLVKLKNGLKAIIDGQAPFLIHCTDGQDQTGFLAALLEALLGGTLEEIEKDAMLTYENYYHLDRTSPFYDEIARRTVFATLREIAGLDSEESLDEADLQEAARDYLVQTVGLSEEQVEDLELRLSGGQQKPEA
ncbi:MAG: hypothetical protein HFE97_11330 [Oscillospiraceae bacterium]|nr:hypothetical protein [Oscillospiraceae bacterium]